MASARLQAGTYPAAGTVGASLAFVAPTGLPLLPDVNDEILHEGWVLKKRRKRMQGFARRYFTLRHSGILSYSFEPGQPTRDHIFLNQAAISTAPGRKDIHVDSGTATFHIKCLSTDDFNQWMSAFRKFIVPEGQRSASIKGTPRLGQLTRSGVVADEMGVTIGELEDAIALLDLGNPLKDQRNRSRSKLDKDKHKEHSHVFGLFKRSSSNHGNSHPDSGLEGQSEYQSTLGQPSPSPHLRIAAALDALKSQHAALVKSLQSLAYIDTNPSTARGSPLPTTAEEDEQSNAMSRFSSPFTRGSRRASLSTTISDGTLSEWYDASDGTGDGAQEFVLEVPPPVEEDEQGSKLSQVDSVTSQEQLADSSADTDTDEEEEAIVRRTLSEDVLLADDDARQVVRRTQLPARPTGDEGSLFAVLKKNVGKDLSTVAFPVTFNVPLTLLQEQAEEVEYYDLLRQAAETVDPAERLAFVAAFAVSSYAHTRHRSSKKGFNPMLAETFEDARMKFIAEKVSHHPLVMAYHAEGEGGEGWELSATCSGKTKFWGKSLEIIPLGTTRLKIGSDHFEWKKPSSFVRNLVIGPKYLEHCGNMIIKNATTNARCVLDFKQSGYFASSNIVSGVILSPSGETVSHLEGKWDDQFALALESSHLRVLWRIAPFPKTAPEYYGFTHFGITLNEITSDIEGRLPPTDSRYRPDVRALEEGDLTTAEEEKTRVEERQRERRRYGADRQPQWFKQSGDEWIYTGGYWEQRARGWKGAAIEPLW